MDLIAAKAKFAQQLNAVLPEIVEERSMLLRDAYHPLLYLNNKEKASNTYPQTIEFHPDCRIIVISGPNAGGKSITLKTVGLLQLMLQSGFLIPVHPRSQVCLFENILTDIGDHQSIENHLSTYSYRLKNMRHFLRKCQAEALFLIDEFGSGSDPELGGALAETFLEEFYHRGAFGMITTHYANLKMLANELPHMANANMVFDRQSLEPTFQLRLGEAGSSYTFEVAQKNGIPFGLINRAKKKVEKGKLRFDKTILSLQKERSKYESETEKLKKESESQRDLSKKNEEIQIKIQDKLERYQELYDTHQKTIYLGNKVSEIADKYFQNGKRKELTAALIRLVEIENSKKKKPEIELPKIKVKPMKKPMEQAVVIKEIEPELEEIRRKKKEKKHKEKAETAKPELPKNVGDRVRLLSGKAIGTIDKIEKNKAIVNYGTFTTIVHLDQLELVEKSKAK
jgi:DNA mismatch repair protein MutS2